MPNVELLGYVLPTKIRVVSSNKTRETALGEITLPVKLGEEEHHIRFVIVPKQSRQFILGSQFFDAFGFMLTKLPDDQRKQQLYRCIDDAPTTENNSVETSDVFVDALQVDTKPDNDHQTIESPADPIMNEVRDDLIVQAQTTRNVEVTTSICHDLTVLSAATIVSEERISDTSKQMAAFGNIPARPTMELIPDKGEEQEKVTVLGSQDPNDLPPSAWELLSHDDPNNIMDDEPIMQVSGIQKVTGTNKNKPFVVVSSTTTNESENQIVHCEESHQNHVESIDDPNGIAYDAITMKHDKPVAPNDTSIEKPPITLDPMPLDDPFLTVEPEKQYVVTQPYTLTEGDKKRLDKILASFPVTDDEAVLNKTPIRKHVIDTGNHPPFQEYQYRVPPHHREAAELELEKMERKGIIRRIYDGPWRSPILFVPKKDNKGGRICLDARKN